MILNRLHTLMPPPRDPVDPGKVGGWASVWRKGNVEVICQRFGIPLLTDFNAFVAAVRARIPQFFSDAP